MVPWDVVVTGAVGVAGIGGTILAAWMTGKCQTADLKLGINAENARARLAEKRRIYANCQASFDRLFTAAVAVRGDERSADAALRANQDAELSSANAAVLPALSELILIAPDDIAGQAEMIRRYLGTYVAESSGGAESDAMLPGLRKQLFSAMRADLGETAYLVTPP